MCFLLILIHKYFEKKKKRIKFHVKRKKKRKRKKLEVIYNINFYNNMVLSKSTFFGIAIAYVLTFLSIYLFIFTFLFIGIDATSPSILFLAPIGISNSPPA